MAFHPIDGFLSNSSCCWGVFWWTVVFVHVGIDLLRSSAGFHCLDCPDRVVIATAGRIPGETESPLSPRTRSSPGWSCGRLANSAAPSIISTSSCAVTSTCSKSSSWAWLSQMRRGNILLASTPGSSTSNSTLRESLGLAIISCSLLPEWSFPLTNTSDHVFIMCNNHNLRVIYYYMWFIITCVIITILIAGWFWAIRIQILVQIMWEPILELTVYLEVKAMLKFYPNYPLSW